jgi:CHASE3 domain sensor protein
VETPFLSILSLAALVLLVTVTGGVGYLTLANWRDRRRQDEEKREIRRSTPVKTTTKSKRKK